VSVEIENKVLASAFTTILTFDAILWKTQPHHFLNITNILFFGAGIKKSHCTKDILVCPSLLDFNLFSAYPK
jgi:hypothetical protein